MILKTFRERLENHMPNKYMRPFACKGNPYKCRIFIVGENPSPKMGKPFLANYWLDSVGFSYDKFYHDYDAIKKSNTGARPRLKKFVCGASPIPCLETNIYATPLEKGGTLSKDEKDKTIFEFLLQEIRPDAIFLYRKEAIKYFQKCFKCEVYDDRFVTVNVFGHETHVLRSPPAHRGFESISKHKVYAIGEKFRRKIRSSKGEI